MAFTMERLKRFLWKKRPEAMAARRAAYPHKADIVRLLAAARAGGLDPAGFELTAEGGIKIIEARAAPTPPVDEFSKWEGRL
jgi:hypothetical protein